MIDFCNPEDGDLVRSLSILDQQFWHILGTAHCAKEKQPPQLIVLQRLMVSFKKQAERGGFEPPVPFGTLVFKTSAFGRSATSPVWLGCLVVMLESYWPPK